MSTDRTKKKKKNSKSTPLTNTFSKPSSPSQTFPLITTAICGIRLSCCGNNTIFNCAAGQFLYKTTQFPSA